MSWTAVLAISYVVIGGIRILLDAGDRRPRSWPHRAVRAILWPLLLVVSSIGFIGWLHSNPSEGPP